MGLEGEMLLGVHRLENKIWCAAFLSGLTASL